MRTRYYGRHVGTAPETRHGHESWRPSGWDFRQVWTGESYSTDAVSPAAWILARTTNIKAGTGIMQMPARTPACAAMTVLSLQALSGNRFLCGVGPSGPQVIEGWHGVPLRQADPANPRIHRHHQADPGARETAGIPRRPVFHPLRWARRHRPGTTSAQHRAWRSERDVLHRLDHPGRPAHGGRSRRRQSADLLLARCARTS